MWMSKPITQFIILCFSLLIRFLKWNSYEMERDTWKALSSYASSNSNHNH